jgi:acetyltransferase-like isoleucine patch superfamily enzyme
MSHRNLRGTLFALLLAPCEAGNRIIGWLKNKKFGAITITGRETCFGRLARVINMRKLPKAIQIGSNCVINGELVTFAHSGMIEIGNWCYVGEGTRIWSSSHISIGNRVLIAHNVNIHDTNSHPVHPEERHAHFVAIKQHGHPDSIENISSEEIVIEDDVWIGFGSIILKGVRIGKRSIIGAGSIVVSDVPPDCLFAQGEILRKYSY